MYEKVRDGRDVVLHTIWEALKPYSMVNIVEEQMGSRPEKEATIIAVHIVNIDFAG